jgi:hypothetical protein
MAHRPKLPKTDEDMQRWCAELEEELSSWPQVSSRPMFGLAAYYRRKAIFAAIPRTRAVDTPHGLLIKLPGTRHERLKSARAPGAGWVTYSLASPADMAEALQWLKRAYDRALERKAKRSMSLR